MFVFVVARLPKFAHQLAHRVVGESKHLCHFLLRSLVYENRPQRFVAPLIRLCWLFEELAISRIVHDLAFLKM